MTISDIVNSIYFRTKTTSTSFPAADMLIFINTAYNRIISLVNKNSRWQWDDTNNSDLPIATTTITANQQDYSLAATHLSIDRVEVKDSGGIWHQLSPFDQSDLRSTALAEYQKNAGTPSEFDIIGSSVFLYPKPNYTQAASLKLYFTRGPAEYTSAEVTTGTKVPGFNSLFHDLIPLWVSYDYAIAHGLANANQLFVEIQRKEDELVQFYGLRNRYEKPRFTVSTSGIGGWQSGRLGTGASDSNE